MGVNISHTKTAKIQNVSHVLPWHAPLVKW